MRAALPHHVIRFVGCPTNELVRGARTDREKIARRGAALAATQGGLRTFSSLNRDDAVRLIGEYRA
jgi:hypothetical protein